MVDWTTNRPKTAAELKDRLAKAKLRATAAITTQDRQLHEGMALYWGELLQEAEAALD